MSHISNDALFDEAAYWAEECAGTTLGGEIQILKDSGDLEGLAAKIKEAKDYHLYLDIIKDQVDYETGDAF